MKSFILAMLSLPSLARATECARELGEPPSFLRIYAAAPETRLRTAALRILGDGPEIFERECEERDARHVAELLDATERYAPDLRVEIAARRSVGRLPLGPLIRLLRTAGIVSQPELQRLLQEVVTDRTESGIRKVVARTRHERGWGPNYALADLIRQDLTSHQGARVEFEGASDNLWIEFSDLLMRTLMHELVTNANQASVRRHGGGRAIVRVRRTNQGGARIEIEDFGNSAEYSATMGVGQSFPAHYGVGIGRFRAYLLANFMGFTFKHAAKGDGSGSIIGLAVRPEGIRTDGERSPPAR